MFLGVGFGINLNTGCPWILWKVIRKSKLRVAQGILWFLPISWDCSDWNYYSHIFYFPCLNADYFPQKSQCLSSPYGFICNEQSLCLHTEMADYRYIMKTSVLYGLIHTHICQLTGLIWWKNLTLFITLTQALPDMLHLTKPSDKKMLH